MYRACIVGLKIEVNDLVGLPRCIKVLVHIYIWLITLSFVLKIMVLILIGVDFVVRLTEDVISLLFQLEISQSDFANFIDLRDILV